MTDRRSEIIQANIAHHAHEAAVYDKTHRAVFNRIEQRRLNRVLSGLARQLRPDCRRALDVGAGTGNVTGKLLALGFTVVAVDLSREMLAQLVRKYRDAIRSGRLSLVVGEAGRLPFAPQSFDLVISYSVLHHLPGYLAGARQMAAALREGGMLYCGAEPLCSVDKMNRAQRVYRALGQLNRLTPLVALHRVSRRWCASAPAGPTSEESLVDYWAAKHRGIDWRGLAAECEAAGLAELPTRPYLMFRGRLRDYIIYPLFRPWISDSRCFIGIACREPE